MIGVFQSDRKLASWRAQHCERRQVVDGARTTPTWEDNEKCVLYYETQEVIHWDNGLGLS